MYEEYFGLNRPPFRITPDTSLFYDGGHRGDILGALVYAVHRGEGIIKVVGEVGSGKTMLCRMLQMELPESIEIIYIANPSVSAEDILFVIAHELKFDIARDASKHEVVSMLHEYLLQKHADDKQVVLFVEEAQSMPLETLEEIRLLSNLETEHHKLLQMILFGQPELDDNLANNSIRQLRERITHDFNLSPLSGSDIHQYLNFRMREVGYTGPELISQKLARNMALHSEGLLRRINILADKMLLSAFAEGTHTLTLKHLLAAVNDSGFSKLKSAGWSSAKLFWLSGFGLLLLLTLVYAVMQSQYFSGIQRNWADAGGAERQFVVDGAVNVPAKIEVPQSSVIDKDEKLQFQKADRERNLRVIQTAAENEVVTQREVLTESKKIQQSVANLDIVNINRVDKNQVEESQVQKYKVQQSQTVEELTSGNTFEDYELWLNAKIDASKRWLRNADKQSVSIQVMMRNKSAGRELVEFLKTEWPLELSKTYLYEVKIQNKAIYRVFYDEYPSITLGQIKMKQLPESVRVNSPYLHSVYRMQKALL